MADNLIISNNETVILTDSTTDAIVTVVEPGPMGPIASLPWEITLPVMGLVIPDEYMLRYDVPDDITILPDKCFGSCNPGNTATANATFRVYRNETLIGTVTFIAGNTEAVVSFSNNSLNSRDILHIYGPSDQDLTLANLSITLKGER